jgi:hypothetical protein
LKIEGKGKENERQKRIQAKAVEVNKSANLANARTDFVPAKRVHSEDTDSPLSR